jgi:hypothetical protein
VKDQVGTLVSEDPPPMGNHFNIKANTVIKKIPSRKYGTADITMRGGNNHWINLGDLGQASKAPARLPNPNASNVETPSNPMVHGRACFIKSITFAGYNAKDNPRSNRTNLPM